MKEFPITDKHYVDELVGYVNSQLNFFYPDGKDCKTGIKKNIDEALDRMFYSLSFVKLKGYTEFDVLHSDLYAQFLYYLSNSVWRNDKDKNLASKLFYLNKSLHGLNCMYDTQLPDIFILIHSVGTVLGKAQYSNYFVACHNVTVGSDKGISPVFSEGVYMGPGSSIIGNCKIGKYTHLAINSVVLDTVTQGDSIIIGNSPNLISKPLNRNLISQIYFKMDANS